MNFLTFKINRPLPQAVLTSALIRSARGIKDQLRSIAICERGRAFDGSASGAEGLDDLF